MRYKSIYSNRIRGDVGYIYDIYSKDKNSIGYLDMPMGSSVLKAVLMWCFKDEKNSDITFLSQKDKIEILDSQYMLKKGDYYIKMSDVTEIVKVSGSGEYGINNKNMESLLGWVLVVVYYNKYEKFKNINIYCNDEDEGEEDIIFKQLEEEAESEALNINLYHIDNYSKFDVSNIILNDADEEIAYSLKDFEVNNESIITLAVIVNEVKGTISQYISKDIQQEAFTPDVIIREITEDFDEDEREQYGTTIEVEESKQQTVEDIEESFRMYNENLKEEKEVNCKYKIEEEKLFIKERLQEEVDKLNKAKEEVKKLQEKVNELEELTKTKYLTTTKILKRKESNSLVIVIQNKSVRESEYSIEIIDNTIEIDNNLKANRILKPREPAIYIISNLPSVYEIRFKGVAENFNVVIGERLNLKSDPLEMSRFIQERVIRDIKELKEIPLDIKDIAVLK